MGSNQASYIDVYNGVHDYVKIQAAAQNGNITLKTGYAGNSGRDTVKIQAYGSSYFNGGYVGIGTNNPKRQFHIHDSNGPYIHLTNDTTGPANSDGVSISLLQDELYIVNREISGTINFEIGSNKAMTMLSNGNVGIGTTNPDYGLSITKIRSVSHPDNTTNGIHMGMVQGSKYSVLELRSTVASEINFGAGSTTPSGRIYYHSTDKSFRFFTNDWATERMRIDGNGNVGIGTNDPDYKLHIDGTDAIQIPVGTTAQRPSTVAQGIIRYNTDLQTFEGYGAEDDGVLWEE